MDENTDNLPKIERSSVIVINSKGERRKIPIKEWEDSGNSLKDFKYDLDYYLKHGFTEANKVFNNLENI